VQTWKSPRRHSQAPTLPLLGLQSLLLKVLWQTAQYQQL
jgi:hypothetical protein